MSDRKRSGWTWILPDRISSGLATVGAVGVFAILALTNAIPVGAWCFCVTTVQYANGVATASAQPGQQIYDTAQITETDNLYVPTGTVTFYLYSNAGCTGSPIYTSAIPYVDPDGSSGGVNPSPWITSGSYTLPTTIASAMTYQWMVSFYEDSTDANGVTDWSGCGQEPVDITVPTNQGSVTTVPNPDSGGTGTPLSDTATVTGLVSPAATDTVTFELYLASSSNPTSCTDGTLEDNFGASSLSGPAGGPWTATSNGSYTPTLAGTYLWQVQFNAVDDPNNLSSQVFCGEPVSIAAAGGQLGASTTAPDTGAGLAGPGLGGGLAILAGLASLFVGLRIRRRSLV